MGHRAGRCHAKPFRYLEGWRYSLGYNVKLFDTLKLGYGNELTRSGYGDLASYQDGTTATTQWRNTFSAGVPISGWGEFSGTYSGLRDTSGEMLERRYGISQSMMLSPNVRLAVGADHDVGQRRLRREHAADHAYRRPIVAMMSCPACGRVPASYKMPRMMLSAFLHV